MTHRVRNVGGVLIALAIALPAHAATTDVRGAWRAQEYVLAEGERHPVEGLIVFTASDWTVVYFVVPEGLGVQRGEGGGGTYTVDEDQLVFTHLFHISAGNELPGLAASELRMVARADASEAPTESSRVERVGDRLTIFFPSGNRLTFVRSSGFE